jgi:hypothetical protein
MTLPWTAEQLGQRLGWALSHLEVVESLEARDVSALLRLRLHGSVPVEMLVFKRWQGTSLRPSATAERRFHCELAPAMRANFTPRVYAAEQFEDDAWILTEDLALEYAHPPSPPTPAQLEAAVTVLATLHAHWWMHPRLEQADLLQPVTDVTRMPQALPESGVQRNAALARSALNAFRARHLDAFAPAEWSLLERWLEVWPAAFLARTVEHTTLLHGDFHLAGNTFFGVAQPDQVKVIDWAQHKRGIGVHDLMYMLLGVDDDRRLERDTRLIRLYHAELEQRLEHRGVQDYPLEQCLWDYRFCVLSHLYQAVFQDSPRWLRRNLNVVQAWSLEGWQP